MRAGPGHHLHVDDCPQTLQLVAALVGHRADSEELGYVATEHGAWIDWDQLAAGRLSSTEIATVHIARGCAALERAGGLPGRLAGRVIDTVNDVAVGRRPPRPGPLA